MFSQYSFLNNLATVGLSGNTQLLVALRHGELVYIQMERRPVVPPPLSIRRYVNSSKPRNASTTFLCTSPNIAQILQGLIDEGMGAIQTPPPANKRGDATMWTSPPQYWEMWCTQTPDLAPAPGSSSCQGLCSGTHYLLHLDQGELPWACRRLRLRHRLSASRTTAVSAAGPCRWPHPMYASSVTQRCTNASTSAWPITNSGSSELGMQMT